MSRNHAAAGNYRDEMLTRTGPKPVCVDFAQGGCRGPIEADHVVPLSQGGPRDWTVPRCQKHHKDKSNRDRGAVMAKAKAKAEPVKPTPTWVRISLLVIGVPLATAPILYSTGQLGAAGHWLLVVAVPLVVLSVGGYAASYTFTERRRHRAEAVQRLATVIAYALKVDLAHVDVEVSGSLSGSARYPQTVLDDDPQIRRTVEERLVSKLGADLAFDWTPELDTVSWTPGQGGRTTDRPAPDTSKAIERTAASLSELVRGPVVLSMSGPGRFTAMYPDKFRDDVDDQRAAFLNIVNQKMPGRWHAAGEWGTADANVVTLERRPKMPTSVRARPDAAAGMDVLPFATGERGDDVVWNPKVAPHLLVSGETGAGKTVLIRTLVARAAKQWGDVRIADPKRVEFAGMRGWPGVTEVATSIEDICELVTSVYDEMDSRYEQVESGTAQARDFAPILFVIDEAREFIDRANAAWRAAKERGEHPAIEQWRSIARLGRSARIYMLVGIQRPDAKVFSGEARDNYGARVALGSMSDQGARMMFGRSDVGRDVPDDVKGRATVDVGSGPIEAQVWFTPDPRDPDLSAQDLALLAGLKS